MAKTILIVEDNELNMKLFSHLLQAHGFNILQSVDGMDTMQLAREHHPDLIIMDIQLPEVSGLEHTKLLKADDDLKDIPVLAVTALDEKTKILETGCDGYMTKPISIKTFLDEVKEFLPTERFLLTESMIVGHAQIDSEHAQIIGLLNEFTDFLEAGDDSGCAGKINEISKAMKSHIENEERIMEELEYRNLEAQKKDHADMMSKIETLIKDSENKGFDYNFAEELNFIFTEDFICGDMDFAWYLQEIHHRRTIAKSIN